MSHPATEPTPLSVEIKTAITHTITVTAPEGKPFVHEDSDGYFYEARTYGIEVILDETGALALVGTRWSARRTMTSDRGKRWPARLMDGTNLTRVPVEVLAAVHETLRDRVGVVRDPKDQLCGYPGGRMV